MSGKNLTFKLILDGDSKGLVSAAKQSEEVTKKVFETIRAEAKNVQVDALVGELNKATKEIGNLGDKSTVSASQLRDMSMQSQQMIGALNTELVGAQAELVELSQTKATPSDIQNAVNRVADLKASIQSVEAAFGIYEETATDAMVGVDKAASKTISEVQKFTSVDLTNIVSEAQSATRAIDSMGDGAIVSTKEVERIGQLGATAIDALQKELTAANVAWKALADSSDDVSLEELTSAKTKVSALEQALELAETSMHEFSQASQQAIPVVDNLDQSLGKANQELNETETASHRVSNEIQGLKTGFTALTGALAALGIGTSAMEIAQTADEYKNLSGRINIAIGEHGNLQKAMDDVKNVAIATNSNLTATGDLYSRLTKIGQEMKWPQEQALALTETINKAIQVGGGSAASNEAAITQLNQALGSGVLRGDEFNSMVEQSPRLTQAMADGLGVTTGQLREMASEGQLTTDVVTKALLSQSEKISAEYAKFPTTIGASIENLKTAWTVYIGEADAASGVSAKVAESIKFVAENLDILVTTLTSVAQVYIAYKALGMASVFLAKANAIRGAQLAIATETASVVANTQAQIANAGASTATALAKTQLATATSASAVANTAAIGSFGKVTTAVSGLKTGLVSVLSRFGAYGIAAAGIVLASDLIIDGLKKTDEWLLRQGSNFIDWSVSKITGTKSLVDQEKEWIAAEEASRKKQEEAAAAKEKNAARTEMLKNASLGLNEVSKATVLEFDKQVKAGEKVSETLDGIAKSFNFDSTTGINNGITALLALQTQGKASGEEIRKALTGILKDEDLVAFQGRLAAIPINIEKQIEATNAKIKAKQAELDAWKKANSEMNQKDWDAQVEKYRTGIEKLQAEASALHVQYANSAKSAAMVQGAVLDEAIRRTGFSYEELQGKSTKAFVSAKNDVNILIGNLDVLKNKGVDVALALNTSFSKAINTATNQKEIDDLKEKINSLRGVLGSTVTNGLLRQAEQQLIDIKDKSDQAKAGINSVSEAFNLFGLKTPEQLRVVAKEYKDAYEEMRNSGLATLAQQQEAFKQYAEKAIAANKGVVDSTILSQAGMLGLKVEVDETGKASVQAMDKWTSANHRVRDSASSIGDGYREAGQTGRDEADSVKSAWEEAVSAASSGMHETRKGTKGKMAKNADDIEAELKAMGYSDAAAKQHAKDIYEGTKGVSGYKSSGFGFFGGLSNVEQVNAELQRMQQYAPNNVSTKASGLGSSSKTISYELKLGNETVQLTGSAESQSNLEAMLKQLGTLSKST